MTQYKFIINNNEMKIKVKKTAPTWGKMALKKLKYTQMKLNLYVWQLSCLTMCFSCRSLSSYFMIACILFCIYFLFFDMLGLNVWYVPKRLQLVSWNIWQYWWTTCWQTSSVLYKVSYIIYSAFSKFLLSLWCLMKLWKTAINTKKTSSILSGCHKSNRIRKL